MDEPLALLLAQSLAGSADPGPATDGRRTYQLNPPNRESSGSSDTLFTMVSKVVHEKAMCTKRAV